MLGKKWSCLGSQLFSVAGWGFLGRAWVLNHPEGAIAGGCPFTALLTAEWQVLY